MNAYNSFQPCATSPFGDTECCTRRCLPHTLLDVVVHIASNESRTFWVGSEFAIGSLLGELTKRVPMTIHDTAFLQSICSETIPKTPTSLTHVVTARRCRTDYHPAENRRKHAGLHSIQPQYPPSIPAEGISPVQDIRELPVYLTAFILRALTTTVHATV